MSGRDLSSGSRPSSPINWPGLGLLFLVNLVALCFLYSPGTGDVSIWFKWIEEIWSSGMVGGFVHSGTDYPPLAFVILTAVAKCSVVFGTTIFLALKVSLLLFLIATAACFYWLSRDVLLTAALEFSLILNSVALGYLDIYFAPFLIAGFFLLGRQQLTGGLLFYAISCTIKWQPLIIAPFVCLYVLGCASASAKDNRMRRQLAPFAVSALLVVILLIIFGAPALFDSFRRATTYHKFLSGYALNLNWIETWALHLAQPDRYGALKDGTIGLLTVDDPILLWVAKILFFSSYAAILFVFTRQAKTFKRLVCYSMLGYLAYFSFNTGVHENHLFLVSCLAWILVFLEPAQLVTCLNFTIATNANLFLFYGVFGKRVSPVLAGFDLTLLFALANLCLFAGFLIQTFKADAVPMKFWRHQPMR